MYVSSEIVVVIVTIIIIFDSSSSTDLQIVVERFGKLSMWRPTVMTGVSFRYPQSHSERMQRLYLK